VGLHAVYPNHMKMGHFRDQMLMMHTK